MCCVSKFIALLLIIVGALNWGLWGFFQYDLVADLFGGNSKPLARLVYSLVGIAGIYGITFFFCKGIYKRNFSGDGSCCKREPKE